MEKEISENQTNQPDLIQVPVVVPEKKPNIGLLIAILLIVTGAVYAGMQIGKKQVSPNEIISESKTPTQAVTTVEPQATIIPTTGETANWKTYINSRYGYKFEYPSSWYFLKMSEDGYGGNDQLSSFNPEEMTPENARITSFWKDKLSIQFQKMIKNKNKDQTLEEWYRTFNQGSPPIERSITKATIDGQNAILTKTSPVVPMNESYFIEKDNSIYFITASGDLSSSNRKIFDQILSTFKFIE